MKTFSIDKSTLPTSRQMAIAVRHISYEWPKCVVAQVTHDAGDPERPYENYLAIPFAVLGELIVRESNGSRAHIVVVRGTKGVVLSTDEEHAELAERAVEAVNTARGSY